MIWAGCVILACPFFVEEVNKNEKLLLPLRFKYSVVN